MDSKQYEMTYGQLSWAKNYNEFVDVVAQAFGGGQ